MSKLFPPDIEERLLKNGRRDIPEYGFPPVAKVYGGKVFAWLLTHIDPRDHDAIFGLSDTGIGHPELEWIRRESLEGTRLPGFGSLRIDPSFVSRHPVGVYAYAAKLRRQITEYPQHLTDALAALKDGALPNEKCCSQHMVKTALWSKRHHGSVSYSGTI